MKIPSLIACVLTSTFIASANLHGQAAIWSAQLDEIRALLKPNDADSADTKNMKASLSRYPVAWQRLLDTNQGPLISSEYSSRDMDRVDLSAIPGLATKIAAFARSIAEENERRENALIAESEALIIRIGETLKTAQKAEDLDPLMLTLSQTNITEYDNNRKLVTISRQLQTARQITGHWQDYLIAKETGNFKESRNHLEQLSSELAITPIIPRSMVLRLLNFQAPKSPDAHVGAVGLPQITLDEIQAKLAESGDTATALAELKATAGSNSNDSTLLRYVQSIEELRKLEPSMAESEVFANIRTIQSSQGRNTIHRAIEQIALNAIARSYAIATPDAKITSARKVLETMAITARDAQDWPKLRKTINSLDNLNSGSYNSDSQKRTYDLKIISLLELGMAAEQRDDLEAAAAAYLEASSIDGQYLQREVAYNKLADLKETSPEMVARFLTKAEENRQRAEAARYAAELESRNQMMMNRGMPGERMRREDLTLLRPLIQEVVAEFLKEKRLEKPQPVGGDAKPNKDP